MSATILIVDDEANLRQTLAYILQSAGYSITTVASGAEALSALQSGPFDLAFLDLKMPEMDGLELLEEIHSLYPQMAIFILTAHATLESAITAMRLGARDYFLKPVDPDTILLRIGAVIEEGRRLQTRRELFDQLDSALHLLQALEQPPASEGAARPAAAATATEPARLLRLGPFTLDLYARRASVDGHPVNLSPSSFDYLAALVRHSPEAVSYQELVREAQGYQVGPGEASDLARWQIYQLRKEIEPQPDQPRYVITVRGIGYRLVT